MPQNEIVYRTGLDSEETLARLLGAPDLKIIHGVPPMGVIQLYWKGRTISCRLGAKGGVQIHYDREDDLESFVKLLKANAVYQVGGSQEWVVTKRYLGMKEVAQLGERLHDSLSELLTTLLLKRRLGPEILRSITKLDVPLFLSVVPPGLRDRMRETMADAMKPLMASEFCEEDTKEDLIKTLLDRGLSEVDVESFFAIDWRKVGSNAAKGQPGDICMFGLGLLFALTFAPQPLLQ